MLTQVNTLIDGMAPLRSIAAAPEGVLRRMKGIAPDDSFVLPASGSSLRMLRSGVSCGRWARSQGADLLHGHGLRWTPLFAAASLSSRRPLVVTLHNLLPANTSVAARVLMRLLLGRAKRIIAVSQAIADGAVARLGGRLKDRIRVIRNGIDFAPFDAARLMGRGAARRELGLAGDASVALCVARLSPEKGVSAFIDAAEQLIETDRFSDARFLIAGDGPERAAIEARLLQTPRLHKHVTLLGARGDIAMLMQAADVVCIPSREEGLGLVAIEAMAAGRPVVATRVGGLPEVVVNGETGLLVPVDDATQLANCMSELFLAPARRASMGAAGRLRALSLFSAERMLAETRSVYEEAICS